VPLGERLDDPDEKVADAAARALAQIGPAGVPELIKGVRSDKVAVRNRSVWALGMMGPDAKEAVGALADALKDAKPNIRLTAAAALGEMEAAAKPAVPALCQLLKDKNAKVRTQAALALSYIGPGAIEPLQRMLADEDPEVRLGAMEAISLIGPDAKDTVEELTKILHDDSANQRIAAVYALGCIGPDAKEAITPLTSVMRDKNGEVQKRTFQALLSVGSGDVPGFLDTMRKLNAEAHWAFPYILKQFGPKAKDAVKPLIKQLDSPDDTIRMSSALALAQLGKDAGEAVGPLQKMFNKEKKPVARHAAGFALARITADPPADIAKQMKAIAEQIEINIKQLQAMLPPPGPWDPSMRPSLFDPKIQDPYNHLLSLHLLASVQSNQAGSVAGKCSAFGSGNELPAKVSMQIRQCNPAAIPAIIHAIHQAAYYDLGFC
jgi:HEAT repeat protein